MRLVNSLLLLVFLLSFALAGQIVAAQQDAPRADPACAQRDVAFPPAFVAWGRPAQALQAAFDQAGAGKSVVTVGVRTKITLGAPEQVKLILPPRQNTDPENPHLGLVSFNVSTAGVYLVSASAPVWLDVLQNGQAVKSTAHGGNYAPCSTVRKTVEFPLQAGPAILQLSSNPGETVDLLIAPKP